jgi:hypothetical protein
MCHCGGFPFILDPPVPRIPSRPLSTKSSDNPELRSPAQDKGERSSPVHSLAQGLSTPGLLSAWLLHGLGEGFVWKTENCHLAFHFCC